MCSDIAEIKDHLITALRTLSLPVDDVNVVVKKRSKCFWGRYYDYGTPKDKRPRIIIYALKLGCDEPYSNSILLYNSIHEMVHYIQYHDPKFIRKKGVMHDADFYSLLNKYSKRAEKIGLIDMKEVRDVFAKESVG